MEKKILVFDTETTGIFSSSQSDVKKQPYICQYAHAIVSVDDDTWDIEETWNKYYKVPISIPKGAQEVHGITNERVKKKKPIYEDLLAIRQKMEEVDILVAHNASFDMNMLWIELSRIDAQYGFSDLREKLFCLMKNTTEYCKLPHKNKDRKGYKWPKLEELYSILFEEEMDNAHCALADVMATVKCLQEIMKRNIIKILHE